MKHIQKIIFPLLVILLFITVFRGWFSTGILSGGDWPYLYPSAITQISPFSSWDIIFSNGLGQNSMPKIWFDSYALTIVKTANILSWPVFERFIWFFPYVFLSFGGAYALSKKFKFNMYYGLITGTIYSLNTYILLIVSGGQVGIFMAYAFFPLALYTFYNLLDYFSVKRSIIFSVALSFLVMLDLRVGYMFLAAVFLIGIFNILCFPKHIFSKLCLMFLLPSIITLLLHFYWIMPILLMGRNPASQLGDIYSSSSSLSFFSFAKMENTIGLLHPNWPENLFGKVAFLKPEFLLIPIIAFSSLLFVGKEQKEKRLPILAMLLLSIIGIFLSKGVNEPFGMLYETFFNRIPGFVMFRDPTKWYIFIAVSFSILIPYTLEKMSGAFKKYSYALCILFLFFWAMLIRDSFTGVLRGTLYSNEVPVNYKSLAGEIESESTFSRTLWIPVAPTFAYVSNNHPAVSALELFRSTSTKSLIQKLNSQESEDVLRNLSIKYVVIPEDTDKKIFVTDRKYDEKVYEKVVKDAKKIKYLSNQRKKGKLIISEVKNPKEHFWTNSDDIVVTHIYKSPTSYEVRVKNAKKGEKLIFTESYDKFWEAKILENLQASKKHHVSNMLSVNSFEFPKNGSYTIDVYYKPQIWLQYGLLVSSTTIIVLVLVIFRLKK